MQITIKNINNLPTIDYREVEPLQGDLKDLNDREYKKLKKVLETKGFDIPLLVWKEPVSNTLFLLDGHQRQRLMVKEDMNDNSSYLVPYILIEAADKKQAKAKLLEITSQYGKITQVGLDTFIAEAELEEAEVYEAVSFDALPMMDWKSPDTSEDAEEEERVSMPKIILIFESATERDECMSDMTDLSIADKHNAKIKIV